MCTEPGFWKICAMVLPWLPKNCGCNYSHWKVPLFSHSPMVFVNLALAAFVCPYPNLRIASAATPKGCNVVLKMHITNKSAFFVHHQYCYWMLWNGQGKWPKQSPSVTGSITLAAATMAMCTWIRHLPNGCEQTWSGDCIVLEGEIPAKFQKNLLATAQSRSPPSRSQSIRHYTHPVEMS